IAQAAALTSKNDDVFFPAGNALPWFRHFPFHILTGGGPNHRCGAAGRWRLDGAIRGSQAGRARLKWMPYPAFS
ncbi:MAG: hypothetical protein QGG45_00005, partial [Alphaproteobacteria bacterium]|nr:hypothetical protein [Alphaproteobacteria bacterium]